MTRNACVLFRFIMLILLCYSIENNYIQIESLVRHFQGALEFPLNLVITFLFGFFAGALVFLSTIGLHAYILWEFSFCREYGKGALYMSLAVGVLFAAGHLIYRIVRYIF